MTKEKQPDAGWMSDVQRALAMILIGSFAFVTVFSTIIAAFWPDDTALVDQAKSLQSNLTNMCLIGLGFFFGNTMAKMTQDAGQQKVVDKLTSTAPPNGGPVAPLPSVPEPWWNSLTEAERTAITASTDQRVIDFVKAPVTIKPLPDDLAYLVSQGLLTQARATEIQSA